MTKVAIMPEPAENGELWFRAVTGDRQSTGKTAGEALDALVTQLPESTTGTFIVVQCLRPDEFFTAEQQQRLAELMQRWRDARDRGQSLPASDQSELDELVEAELRASADRTSALLAELQK